MGTPWDADPTAWIGWWGNPDPVYGNRGAFLRPDRLIVPHGLPPRLSALYHQWGQWALTLKGGCADLTAIKECGGKGRTIDPGGYLYWPLFRGDHLYQLDEMERLIAERNGITLPREKRPASGAGWWIHPSGEWEARGVFPREDWPYMYVRSRWHGGEKIRGWYDYGWPFDPAWLIRLNRWTNTCAIVGIRGFSGPACTNWVARDAFLAGLLGTTQGLQVYAESGDWISAVIQTVTGGIGGHVKGALADLAALEDAASFAPRDTIPSPEPTGPSAALVATIQSGGIEPPPAPSAALVATIQSGGLAVPATDAGEAQSSETTATDDATVVVTRSPRAKFPWWLAAALAAALAL